MTQTPAPQPPASAVPAQPAQTAPPAVATTLNCSQCGGVLQPAPGEVFLTCPYCSSTVYLDRSRVVLHWAVACTLKPEEAQSALFRWMAGNQTVKDLDRKARVTGQAFQYFPLWYFRAGSPQDERIYLEPAAPLSISELKKLPLPAGDLLRYDPSLDAQAVAPDVTLQAATQWLANMGVDPDGVRETSLVHVPIYTFKYAFGGQTYTTIVDGAAGRVFANIYPAKWEMPYLAIGGGDCLLYFLISWIPVIAAQAFGAGGLAIGVLVYLIAAVLLAIPLFVIAAWISAKV